MSQMQWWPFWTSHTLIVLSPKPLDNVIFHQEKMHRHPNQYVPERALQMHWVPFWNIHIWLSYHMRRQRTRYFHQGKMQTDDWIRNVLERPNGSCLLHFLLMETTLSLGLVIDNRVWDVRKAPLHLAFKGTYSLGQFCACSPDGKYIVTGLMIKLNSVGVQKAPLLWAFWGTTDWVNSLHFSWWKYIVLNGSDDNDNQAWIFRRHHCIWPVEGHSWFGSSLLHFLLMENTLSLVCWYDNQSVDHWERHFTWAF